MKDRCPACGGTPRRPKKKKPPARAVRLCSCGVAIRYAGRGRPALECSKCRDALGAIVCSYCEAPVEYAGRGRPPSTCGSEACRRRQLEARPSSDLASTLDEADREAYREARDATLAARRR